MTVFAATPARADCDVVPTTGDDVVVCSGIIAGNVDLLAGDDFITLTEGSQIDGRLVLGQGQDEAVIAGRVNGKISMAMHPSSRMQIDPSGQERITITATGSVVNTNSAQRDEPSAITVTESGHIINYGLIDNSSVAIGPHTDAIYFSYAGTAGTSVENVIENYGTIIGRRAAIQDASSPGATRRYVVTNTGSITALGSGPAMRTGDANGDDLVRNIGGRIVSTGIALQLGLGADQVFNLDGGTIDGRVDLGANYAGDVGDYLFNGAGSQVLGDVWTGDGDDRVDNAGSLAGAVDLGNGADRLFNLAGGSIAGVLRMGDGDDLVDSRGHFAANVDLGDGVDQLVLGDAASLADGVMLDGGADLGATPDRLVFDRWQGVLSPGQVLNWSQLDLQAGSKVTFGAGTLALEGAASGLMLRDGSLAALAGDLVVDGGLANAGVLDMTANADAPGRVLTVGGDYAGSGGQVVLNTVLDDGSSGVTDRLHVSGDTSGHTRLMVRNLGGAGGLTGSGPTDGIRVVEVEGASAGTFSLSENPVVGAYVYDLVQADSQDWYLQSVVLPQMAAYRGLGMVLRQNVATFAARRQGRRYVATNRSLGRIARLPVLGFAEAPVEWAVEQAGEEAGEEPLSGLWARIGGSRSRALDHAPGAGGRMDSHTVDLELGVDLTRELSADSLVGLGIYGFWGREAMRSRFPDGSTLLDSRGWHAGFGSELTIRHESAGYLNLLAEFTGKQLDIAVPSRSVSDEASAWLAAFAAEYGRNFSLGEDISITPYGQVMLGVSHLDAFRDGDGVSVEARTQSEVRLRAGARFERRWQTASNLVRAYLDADLAYDPKDQIEVSYFGADRHLAHGKLWGELNLGVSGNVGGGNELSLGVGFRTPLEKRFADSYTASLSVGLNHRF